MKTLENLTEELVAAQKTAAIDVEEMPANARGGWATRVREAKDGVAALRKEYSEALLKSSVAIFLEGAADKVEVAVTIFSKNNGLVVDASALYDRLTKAVEPTISQGRSWGVAQTHRLHLAIQDVMHDIGITEMEMPSRDQSYVATAEDTRRHIKSVIQGAVGDNLNRLYVTKCLVDRAIEIRYTAVTVPVLVLGAEVDEAANLTIGFGKGFTTLKLDEVEEVTEEALGKLLKEAGKKVRKK